MKKPPKDDFSDIYVISSRHSQASGAKTDRHIIVCCDTDQISSREPQPQVEKIFNDGALVLSSQVCCGLLCFPLSPGRQIVAEIHGKSGE